MKEIEWKHEPVYGGVCARIGNVLLRCRPWKREWQGSAQIGYVVNYQQRRFGKWRKSLSRAKEEAIQLAREMLTDYTTCLDKDMKNFGIITNAS